MKDWIGIYFAPCIGWIIAVIDWNEITLAFACFASAASAVTTVLCGISKVLSARNARKTEEFMHLCEAMLERDRVCDECIAENGSFAQNCNFKYRHKNCPKEVKKYEKY